jgi:hypothetical protein
MSVDDYPLRAKDGLAITVTETYLKLVDLTVATQNPNTLRLFMDMMNVPGEDRLAFLECLSDRKARLQDTLRQQISMVATLKRQAQ